MFFSCLFTVVWHLHPIRSPLQRNPLPQIIFLSKTTYVTQTLSFRLSQFPTMTQIAFICCLLGLSGQEMIISLYFGGRIARTYFEFSWITKIVFIDSLASRDENSSFHLAIGLLNRVLFRIPSTTYHYCLSTKRTVHKKIVVQQPKHYDIAGNTLNQICKLDNRQWNTFWRIHILLFHREHWVSTPL